MAISQDELTGYIEDYNRTQSDQNVGHFVCPITLRQCEPHELIKGHILPEALVRACRRTVIQYGDVDHFSSFKAGRWQHIGL